MAICSETLFSSFLNLTLKLKSCFLDLNHVERRTRNNFSLKTLATMPCVHMVLPIIIYNWIGTYFQYSIGCLYTVYLQFIFKLILY